MSQLTGIPSFSPKVWSPGQRNDLDGMWYAIFRALEDEGNSTGTSKTVYCSQAPVVVAGSPTIGTFDNVTVVVLPGTGADSYINFWFRAPEDVDLTQPLVMLMNYAAGSAPTAPDVNVSLAIAVKVNNALYGPYGPETIVLQPTTDWYKFEATTLVIPAGVFGEGDLIQVLIRRDISVLGNAPIDFDIAQLAWKYQ